MFDVSWGEITVVVGLGLFLIGRKDLPKAANVAGSHLGRVVGMLQGARARADAFAQNNELRALHNEVKSGLRELDAVKAELAISLSPSQMMQLGQRNNLGTMVSSANRNNNPSNNALSSLSSSYRQSLPPPPLQSTYAQNAQIGSTTTFTATAAGTESSSSPTAASSSYASGTFGSSPPPPPLQHHYEQQQQHQEDLLYKNNHHASIAAVAEEEWIKQGIHFKSRAEQGPSSLGQQNQKIVSSPSGSALLSHVLQQSLIFDQYDHVIQQQEQSMQNRMRSIQEKVQTKSQSTTKT